MMLRLSWPAGYYALYPAKLAISLPPSLGNTVAAAILIGAAAAFVVTTGNNKCPQETGFQWREGSVTDPNLAIPRNSNSAIDKIGIGTVNNRNEVEFSFCSKTRDPSSEYFSPQWPAGKYCILRKSIDPGQGECPPSKFCFFGFAFP